MNEKLEELLHSFKDKGFVTVLTGAGISAESNIPTFRGPEGYWKIGSRNYYPQEMATHRMFSLSPYEVWKWYLYRRYICNHAKANKGHLAIVKLEQNLKDRFSLITQNVDGLHIRAGNSRERTCEIHGNINLMRCSRECTDKTFAIPAGMEFDHKDRELSSREKSLLICPECLTLARPHILWFDECYDEIHYKFETSISITEKTDLLIVIGTTGNTTLPSRIITTVMKKNRPVIVIDPFENEVTSMIEQYDRGYYLSCKSGEIVPEICDTVSRES
ncbi:MAG: Sir2 family NAD-dependent protein deacetylase [Candidatus Eremiobacterota bacterium]